MSIPIIEYCPGTLAAGNITYSTTCLRRLFDGKKVSHIFPYESPVSTLNIDDLFVDNRSRISISGVQEKFSVIQDKNILRLTNEGEQGTHILKPIPSFGDNKEFMPANEHLSMQIARQVYGIETAENALVFFKNGEAAYITKRFDVGIDGKLAKEDFASLAKLSPQTHGENYKYTGNYLDMFSLIKKYLPTYRLEAPKLFRLIVFNYLFSNGDAHFKNFSILETPQGDYRLSPAYDLLNTRIHIGDSDFALEDDLLPKNMAAGNILKQFRFLAEKAEISEKQTEDIIYQLMSDTDKVEQLIDASYLSDKLKRNYFQAYQTRLNKLKKYTEKA